MLNFEQFLLQKQEPEEKQVLKTFQDWLAETTFDFGKAHKGKDHTQVPDSYLRWALENAPKAFSPAFKKEIEQHLNRNSSPQPTAQANQGTQWVLAKVIGQNSYGLNQNELVALSKGQSGWNYVQLSGSQSKGTIAGNEVANIVQSLKDNNGQPIKSSNLDDFKQYLPKPEAKPKKSPLIPDELMSDEQKAIDAKFEEFLNSSKQSHITIGAGAGTGKTTMLNHLAWKYGNPNQKWLYLVFNTKNKVEATEKFPPWVQVRTTNGFLGEILKDKSNISKMPQTERLIGLNKFANGDEKDSKLEKTRLLVDGPEFTKLVASLGIPNNADTSQLGKFGKTIDSLIKSIRYHFKEQVLTLTGLAKSFALDPRNQNDLSAGIEKILNSYDIDTQLTEVKERISKYGGSYKTNVVYTLQDILHYDFMAKDFREEIIKATNWLLRTSMPHGTAMQFKHGNINYNLGEFRDFSDDLWFAATHADQIQWPNYTIVLADESQDFAEPQKIMLKKLHEAGAKIVAVGDENQSLYRFRGADSDAFKNLTKQLADQSHDKSGILTLSKNFRSRPAILDFAAEETHVKNLKQGKQFKDGWDGEATKFEVKYDNAFSQLKDETQNKQRKQTAFISRTNEPLVHAALRLLGDGTPFIIVGKDIAKDLKKHIAKTVARFGISDQDDVDDLSRQLNQLRDDETNAHHGQSTKKAYLQDLNEVTDALTSAISQFTMENPNNANISNFKVWIGQRLGGLDVEENEKDLKEYQRKIENENPVILTTAHKSKGLEFSRVYILRYDLFPHKKAKRPEDLRQEANSKYVAITRAQDEIHVLDLEDQPGYKK